MISAIKFAAISWGNLGYCEISGREENSETIIFVHGFPDTLHTWQHVMPRVHAATGARCIALALPGYLPSDIPTIADRTNRRQALGRTDRSVCDEKIVFCMSDVGQDLLEFIDVVQSDKTKHVILVGHDWGAYAVYAAASLDQINGARRVARVVGIAVVPPRAISFSVKLLWTGRHFAYFNSPFDQVAGTKANDFAYIDELYARWSPKWSVPATETQQIKQDFADDARLGAAIQYYHSMRATDELSQVLQARRWEIPFLYFGGDADGVASVALHRDAAKQMNSSAPFARVVIVRDAGHWVHREKPETFVSELIRFVQCKDPLAQWGARSVDVLDDRDAAPAE